MAIVVDLDIVMTRRHIGVAELAGRIGITPANLSVLKNGHAKAIRFTTLDAICRELECEVGEILRHVPDEG